MSILGSYLKHVIVILFLVFFLSLCLPDPKFACWTATQELLRHSHQGDTINPQESYEDDRVQQQLQAFAATAMPSRDRVSRRKKAQNAL
jgi:hypothetical protein